VSSVDSLRNLIQCVVHVETLDAQLSSKAAIAERSAVRPPQHLAEGLHQVHLL